MTNYYYPQQHIYDYCAHIAWNKCFFFRYFLISHLHFNVFFILFSQELRLTKTGQIVRPPDKFQSGDWFDPRKLFKKAVPPKTQTATIAETPMLRFVSFIIKIFSP